MSELLSSITGGGGGFIAKFASPLVSVASGSTGTIATITPPAGQKVRLTAIAASVLQINLTTITIGGSDVVTSVLLDVSGGLGNQANEFYIGFGSPNQVYIDGDIDEAIEIKTNVATTSNTIYTYQFGV
jgi:hypothetical protein